MKVFFHVIPLCLFITSFLSGCFHKNNPNEPHTPSDAISDYQVLFQANFDGIGTPLSDFKLINDANRVNSYYGGLYDDAWIVGDMSKYNANRDNKMAVSCAWFEEPSTADRWMITPVFEVKGEKPYLYWEEITPDPNLNHTYKVLIAPEGGSEKVDFTEVLYKIPDGQNGATINTIRHSSLEPYKGKKVRVAFVNSANDAFLVGIDNIFAVAKKLSSVPINMSTVKIAPNKAELVMVDLDESTTSATKRYTLSLVPYTSTNISDGMHYGVDNLHFEIDNLSPATRYHGYIKAGESNHWSGPYPIQTAYNIPFVSDVNGDVFGEGWTLDGMTLEDSAPIDGSKAFVATAVPDEISVTSVKLPAVYMDKNKPFTFSFDFMTEALAGNVSVLLYTEEPGDLGANAGFLELTAPFQAGETFKFANDKLELLESGSYYFAIVVSTYVDKPADKQNFKVYIDNIKISYND